MTRPETREAWATQMLPLLFWSSIPAGCGLDYSRAETFDICEHKRETCHMPACRWHALTNNAPAYYSGHAVKCDVLPSVNQQGLPLLTRIMDSLKLVHWESRWHAGTRKESLSPGNLWVTTAIKHLRNPSCHQISNPESWWRGTCDTYHCQQYDWWELRVSMKENSFLQTSCSLLLALGHRTGEPE